MNSIEWYTRNRKVNVLKMSIDLTITPSLLRRYINGEIIWKYDTMMRVIDYINEHYPRPYLLSDKNCYELKKGLYKQV